MSGLLVRITELFGKKQIDKHFDKMGKETRAWELRAARGECGWTCVDCGISDSLGMPDKCYHNNDRCNKLIARDKKEAFEEVKK